MCIRDRAAGEGEALLFVDRNLQHAGQLVFDRILDGDDLVAVSYTHLRAHETVLDLVCRLLLEKKKRVLL